MATFDFSRLADIEKIAGDRLEKVIRGTFLDMTRKIVIRTPVGNPDLWQSPAPPGYVGGTARGNWQASINSPSQNVLYEPDENGSRTIAAAQPMIESAIGNVFYLTNNVPYITRLEYGWSTQAPNGFVRRTLRELNKDIDQQVAKLPR